MRPGELETTEPVNQLDIQHWYRRVYAQCHALLMSATDAEDATQETFVRAWSSLSELRSASAMNSWLRNIARNVCVDMIRRNQIRRTQSAALNEVAVVSSSECLDKSEECEHVMHYVTALPEELREIVLLHYYEQLTYDQMAHWLGVARSTVNERLAKARLLLKQQLCMEKSR